MKRENLYSIVVFNDYEVKKAVEWLSKKTTKIFNFTGVKFSKDCYHAKTEDEALYCRAAAKFQHLMVL